MESMAEDHLTDTEAHRWCFGTTAVAPLHDFVGLTTAAALGTPTLQTLAETAEAAENFWHAGLLFCYAYAVCPLDDTAADHWTVGENSSSFSVILELGLHGADCLSRGSDRTRYRRTVEVGIRGCV